MSKNETLRRPDAKTAARQTLAFLILAYVCCIIWVLTSLMALISFGAAEDITVRSRIVDIFVFYSAFALLIISQAWYIYGGIRRKRGSKGPNFLVGVIVPTVVGYVIFVPISFLWNYEIFILIGWAFYRHLILLEPIYIALFYLFVARKGSEASKPSKETRK